MTEGNTQSVKTDLESDALDQLRPCLQGQFLLPQMEEEGLDRIPAATARTTTALVGPRPSGARRTCCG